MDQKDPRAWRPVLMRAMEDINLSLALRQACRSAVEEAALLATERDALRTRCNTLTHRLQELEARGDE